MRGTILFSTILVLGACGGGADGEGGSEPAATPHAGGEHHGDAHRAEGDGHGHGAHDHPELPDALRAFHDAFAPIWHSEAGAERAGTACDASAELAELAAAAEGDAPDGSSPTLATSAQGLTEACGDPSDVEAVDGALTRTHDAFHEIMGAVRGTDG